MRIETSRFGPVDVEPTRILTFPKGILGFPAYTRYVLLEAGEDASFWWLQSVDAPDLAFIVTDPTLFVPTYRVPIRGEQMSEMGLSSLDEAQVLVIVNKRGRTLTGNLQGPLVVHLNDRTGVQLVLSDRRYTTRVPLVELAEPVHAASA
ncbi:MAG: flagellar assembly protein FliW [Phycisphaeraceae bacterium]